MPGMDDDLLPEEVQWPASATRYPSALRAKSPSAGGGSDDRSAISPPISVSSRRRRSGRTSVSSSMNPEQAYDEFIRMQNVNRFMFTEKERARRVAIARDEHDAWMELREAEREERLRLGGEPTRPSTPSARRSIEFTPPIATPPSTISRAVVSPRAVVAPRDSPSPPAVPLGETMTPSATRMLAFVYPSVPPAFIGKASGSDKMPDRWRDNFRGIYLKPTPVDHSEWADKPKEANCCSVQ